MVVRRWLHHSQKMVASPQSFIRPTREQYRPNRGDRLSGNVERIYLSHPGNISIRATEYPVEGFRAHCAVDRRRGLFWFVIGCALYVTSFIRLIII
jgi:hypothetical protein